MRLAGSETVQLQEQSNLKKTLVVELAVELSVKLIADSNCIYCRATVALKAD